MSLENTIYSRFEVTKPDGVKVKLRMQEARKQDQDQILDFLNKWYLREETFSRCAGIPKNEETLKEMSDRVHKSLSKEAAPPALLCCVDQDELEIVGCNIFILSKRGETPDLQYKSNEVKLYIDTIMALKKVYNVHEEHDVDRCLSGAGLGVDKSYRGCGIATELFRARKPLLQKLGIPLSGVWLTSPGSQRAAARAGYERVAEIAFEELGKMTGITYYDVPKMCVYSILRA